MARDAKEQTPEEVAAATPATEGTAAATATPGSEAAAVASDERYKMVTPPPTKNEDGTETPSAPVKRAEYIRDLWARKMSRGDIARHLTQITGKKVPYQIVFAATKGHPGGPDKTAGGEVVVPPAPPAPGAAQ